MTTVWRNARDHALCPRRDVFLEIVSSARQRSKRKNIGFQNDTTYISEYSYPSISPVHDHACTEIRNFRFCSATVGRIIQTATRRCVVRARDIIIPTRLSINFPPEQCSYYVWRTAPYQHVGYLPPGYAALYIIPWNNVCVVHSCG